MKLLYYPDSHLVTPCEVVTEFNDELKDIITQMKIIMSTNNGLGLAANQCGVAKQIFIMQDKKQVVHEFINPKITYSEGSIMGKEGCLSFKDIFLDIARPDVVGLEYQDINGEHKRSIVLDMDARVVCHEMQHLLGETFLSKVSRQVRKRVISQVRRK